MEKKVTRPISIWFTQIVLTLVAAFMTLYMAFIALLSVSEGKPPSLSAILSILIPLGMLVVLELLSVLLLALRKSAGRWLACILLIIQGSLFCMSLLADLNDWRDIFGSFLLIIALPLFLVLSLIFNKKVARFFAPHREDMMVPPPPPPSFD